MVRFTLKQCGYVLAVAEHGGIARAARALNISQPALAQAVDKLEMMVGLTLFIRHHARGVETTRQGEEFLKLARRLVDCADGVAREAASIAADLSGAIRLGCFHTIAPFHAASLAKRYRSLYPRVGVAVTEGLQDELVAGIAAGRLDLAVLYDMALDRSRLTLRVVAEGRSAPAQRRAQGRSDSRKRSKRQFVPRHGFRDPSSLHAAVHPHPSVVERKERG